MHKYRRHLPSLDSLVFFEAAARHNSFTRAAGELYVTQAAVSKRIRELEARLGLALFRRDGRLLSLTDTGRRFYQRVDTALEFLDDACRHAIGDQPQPLRIAANSAVSLLWLPPRLKRFGLGEQAVNVNLTTSDRLTDTLDPDNDLVVAYGNGEIPGWQTELIFMETLVPVASPDYFATIGGRDGAAGLEFAKLPTLLEYERLAPDWINWQVWIERTGSSELSSCPTLHCRTYAQAIGAALDGKGLALGSRGLLDGELNATRLRVVGERELSSGRGYYLAHAERREPGPGAQALRRSLLGKD